MLKYALQNIVNSNQRNAYRQDDIRRAAHAKRNFKYDLWWDKIDYILTLTDHIYNMLGICSTGASTLHLVYEMRDSWQGQLYIGIISKRKQMRYANLDGARVVLHFIVWSIHLIQGNFFKLIFYLWIKIILFHSSITLISVYRS